MRHLVTALVLVGAGVFYIIGFGSGVIAALALAVILELWFWKRLLFPGKLRKP